MNGTDPCYQLRLTLESIEREMATLKRRRWVILQEMAKLTLYSQGTAILPPHLTLRPLRGILQA